MQRRSEGNAGVGCGCLAMLVPIILGGIYWLAIIAIVVGAAVWLWKHIL